MKIYWRVVTMATLAWMVSATVAYAAEYTVFDSKKHGFSLKLPKEFKMEGTEDKTTQWSFQPGSAASAAATGEAAKPAEEKKGKKLGAAIGSLVGAKVKADAPTPQTAGPKSELEPALTIYVNWVWMPDVSSKTGFDANKKSDQQDISSPDPKYRDLVVMTKDTAYAVGNDLAYRYKEIDKKDPNEIHRWHVKAYGNKSFYTLGFCGTYKQFEKWAPVYEECIKSLKLIPLEGAK